MNHKPQSQLKKEHLKIAYTHEYYAIKGFKNNKERTYYKCQELHQATLWWNWNETRPTPYPVDCINYIRYKVWAGEIIPIEKTTLKMTYNKDEKRYHFHK